MERSRRYRQEQMWIRVRWIEGVEVASWGGQEHVVSEQSCEA